MESGTNVNSESTDMGSLMQSLPEHSRLWVFPLKEALSNEKTLELSKAMTAFLASWDSHGAQVFGAFTVSHDRFLVVAADQEASSVSGCSIDSLFRTVSELLQSQSLEIANLSDIFYLDGESVRQVSRAEFKTLSTEGKLNEETLVFDTSIQKLTDYQSGKWLIPRKNSWHERLL